MNVLIEPNEEHPLAKFAGDLADSDMYDDWVEEMKLYREQRETEHPASAFIGMWKDNPLFEDWQKAVEEYRQKKDKELD
jgi:hypothetical protein